MKKKIIITCILLLVAACIFFVFFFKKEQKNVVRETSQEVSKHTLIGMRPDVHYVEIPKVDIQNLHMLGKISGKNAVEGDDGKIARALCYRNIVEAVADRYCNQIPAETILAILAYESGGGALLCNSRDDGGIGCMHMQGSTACWLGLHTYDSCSAIICNGNDSLSCMRIDTVFTQIDSLTYEDYASSDYTDFDYSVIDPEGYIIDTIKKNHGAELRELYEKYKDSTHVLIKYDDRFNVLLNVDAWVRLLVYYLPENTPEGFYSPLEYSVYKCSGKKPDYWSKVNNLAYYIADKNYLMKIESKFNQLNPELTINGQRADYKAYMDYCYKDNFKFGLEKYKKLEKVRIIFQN